MFPVNPLPQSPSMEEHPKKTTAFTNTTTGSVVSRSTDFRQTERSPPSPQEQGENPSKDHPFPSRRGRRGRVRAPRFLTTEKEYLDGLLQGSSDPIIQDRYQRRKPARRIYHPYRDPGPLPPPKREPPFFQHPQHPFCWDDSPTTPPRRGTSPLDLEETKILRNIPMEQIFNFSEQSTSFFDPQKEDVQPIFPSLKDDEDWFEEEGFPSLGPLFFTPRSPNRASADFVISDS